MFDTPTLLQDLSGWDSASSAERRLAIQQVARQIAAQFQFLHIETYSCGGQRHEIAAFSHRKTGIRFHLLPGGSYQMGASTEELATCQAQQWGGDLAETPAREVLVPPFLASRFLVTEGPWKAHAGTELYFNLGQDHPIDAVSRLQCRDWAHRVGLRLLSEAEWEYACRAGSQTVFFWGDQPDASYAWMKEHPVPDDYRNHPEAAHADKANAFGMVDMLGSLAEWVEDDVYYYEDQDDDWEPVYSERPNADGIQRGGCFMYGWNLCRCSTRIQCSDYGDTGMGLRVACSLEQAAEGDAPADAATIVIPSAENNNPASETTASKKPWWKIW